MTELEQLAAARQTCRRRPVKHHGRGPAIGLGVVACLVVVLGIGSLAGRAKPLKPPADGTSVAQVKALYGSRVFDEREWEVEGRQFGVIKVNTGDDKHPVLYIHLRDGKVSGSKLWQ